MTCKRCHWPHDDTARWCDHCAAPLIDPNRWRVRWQIDNGHSGVCTGEGPWVEQHTRCERFRSMAGPGVSYALETWTAYGWVSADQWRGQLITEEGVMG